MLYEVITLGSGTARVGWGGCDTKGSQLLFAEAGAELPLPDFDVSYNFV